MKTRDEFLWMLTTGEGLPHGDLDEVITSEGFGVVSLETLKEIDRVLIGAMGHIPDPAARDRAIDALAVLREQAPTSRHGV